MALVLVQEIPLDTAPRHCVGACTDRIAGRIDHFAVDVLGKRIFLACLGNNTVEVVDAYTGAKVYTIGCREGEELDRPTGLCYVPGGAHGAAKLYVANAGGFVDAFDGTSLAWLKRIIVSDADNLRYSPSAGIVLVGCGDGEIAAIDCSTNELRNDGASCWALGAHPESFQLMQSSGYVASTEVVIVNVADAASVVALPFPPGSPQQWACTLPAPLGANFAMALNAAAGHVLIVTRRPPRLVVLDATSGALLDAAVDPAAAARCVADADDVFFDDQRRRVYVIGGAGFVSVYQFTPASPGASTDSRLGMETISAMGRYIFVQEVPTAVGARTGTWFAGRHRLYVAAPATSALGARLLVYEATDAVGEP